MALPPTLDDENLYKFRTKICERYVKQGRCEFADKCQYSHDLRWTRRPPWKYNYHPELCHDLQFVKDGRGRTIAKSNCKQKRNCKFAHTKEEQVYHPKVYKTAMCKQFQTSAWCDRYYCPFAHSTAELRPSDSSFLSSKVYTTEDQDSLCPDIYLPSDKPHPRLRARFLAIMESVGPGPTQQTSNPASISESGASQSRSRQPYTDFISSHTPQSVRSEPLSPTALRQTKLAENLAGGAESRAVNGNCSSSNNNCNSNSNGDRVFHVAGALEPDYRPVSLRRMLQTAARHIQDKAEMKKTSHEKSVELPHAKHTTTGVDQTHPTHGRLQVNSTQQHQQPNRQQQQAPFKTAPPSTRTGKSPTGQLRSIDGSSLLGYPPRRTQATFISASQQPQTKASSQSTAQSQQLAQGTLQQTTQASDCRGKTSHVPSRPTACFKTGSGESRQQGTNIALSRLSSEPPSAQKATLVSGSASAAAKSAPPAVAVPEEEERLRHGVGKTDHKRAAALPYFDPKQSGRLHDNRSSPVVPARGLSTQNCASLDCPTGAGASGLITGERLQTCSGLSMRGPATELHVAGPLERLFCAVEEQQTKNGEVSSRRGSTEKGNFIPLPESGFNFQVNLQQMYGGAEASILPGALPPLQSVNETSENIAYSTLSSFVPRIQQGFASGLLNVLADDVYYWSEPIGHSKDDPFIQVFAGVMLGSEKQREVVAVKRIPIAATGRVRETLALLEKFTQLEDPLIVNVKRVYCLRNNSGTCSKEAEDNLSLMLVLEKCEGRLSDMISLSDLGERCLQEPLPPPGMTEMLSHLISGVLKIQQQSRGAHMRIHPGNVLLTEDFELKIGDCTGKIRYLSIIELLQTGLQGAQQARDIIHWILNSPTEASWLSPELLRSFMYMAQQISLLVDQYKMFPPHARNGISFALLAQNLKWNTTFLQKADAWSTGATLFYIVSGGHHPYGDPEDRSTVKNVLEDRKIHLEKIRGSPLIYDLVESLLEGDPDKRLNLCQALCHPAFWKMGETEHFLKEFKATVEAHPDCYLVLALSDPFPWISSLACGASPLFSLLVSYLASPSCPQLLLTSLRVENGLSFLLFLSLLSSDARLPGKERRALVSSAILLHPAAFLKAVRLFLFPRVPRDPAELVISRSLTYVKHYLGHFSGRDLLHATAQPSSSSVSKHFGRADLRSGAGNSTTGTCSTSSSGTSCSGSKTGGNSNSGNGGNPDDLSSPPPMQLLDACKGATSRSMLFDQCQALCPSYSGPQQLQRQSQPLPPPPPPMPSRCDASYGVRLPPATSAVGRSPNQTAAPSFVAPHALFVASPPGVHGAGATGSPVAPGSLGLPSVARPPPPPPPPFLAAEAGINSQQPGSLSLPFNERLLLANAVSEASLLLPSTARAQLYAGGNAMHEAPPAHPGFTGSEAGTFCSASARMTFQPAGPLGLEKKVSQTGEAMRLLFLEKNACASAACEVAEGGVRTSTAEDTRTSAGGTRITAGGEGTDAAGERQFKQVMGSVQARAEHIGHSHGLNLSPLSSDRSLSNAGPGLPLAATSSPEIENVNLHVNAPHIPQQRYLSVDTGSAKPFTIYSFDDKYTDSCAYSSALHIPKKYGTHAPGDAVGHSSQRKQYGSDAMKTDLCHIQYPGPTTVEASICRMNNRKTSSSETVKEVGHPDYPEEYDAHAGKESVSNNSAYPRGYSIDACKERGAEGSAPRAGSTSASSQSTRLYTSSTPPVSASDKAEEQFQFLKHQESSSQLLQSEIKREIGAVSLEASNCTVSPSHDSCLSEGASTTHLSAFPSEAAQPDTAEPPLKIAAESGQALKKGEQGHTDEREKLKEKGDRTDGREGAEKKTEEERAEVVDHGKSKGRKIKHNVPPKKEPTGETHKKESARREGPNKTKTSC